MDIRGLGGLGGLGPLGGDDSQRRRDRDTERRASPVDDRHGDGKRERRIRQDADDLLRLIKSQGCVIPENLLDNIDTEIDHRADIVSDSYL